MADKAAKDAITNRSATAVQLVTKQDANTHNKTALHQYVAE